MDLQNVFELVFRSGDVMSRSLARTAQFLLELLFVAATWLALLVIGLAMAFQRGGLPWTDPSDARATSRSAGSTARRILRR
jgi:hypothetical protein